VLGYGAHPDPAGEVARSVRELQVRRGDRPPILTIATLTGTAQDPQDRDAQARKLAEAGVALAESVRAAILLALRAIAAPSPTSGEVPELLRTAPAVVNVGLRGFADDLHANGVRVVHQQWEPVAGGDERLQRLLARVR